MKNNKKFILFFILGLLILSVVFMTVVFYQQSKQQTLKIKADAIDLIDQRLNNTYSEINSFPSGAADNLLFLSKLSEFQLIGNILEKDSNIEKDFLEFLAQSEAYYQVLYLSNEGNVLLRAEYDGNTRQIISTSTGLQEKSYFDLLKNLKSGEVYIYPLSLENKVPILKYATPIYNQKTNKLKGIILVKVYADYFLDSIRRSQREGEVTYLINSDGFYLANPNKNKEFGYLFKNEKDNFFVEYPKVSRDIINKCEERHVETDDKIFTYRCINPTITNFEIYKGLKTIDEKSIDSYQWLLITVTDKSDGLKDFSKQKHDYSWAIGIQILIQGIVFTLFLINNKLYEKNN